MGQSCFWMSNIPRSGVFTVPVKKSYKKISNSFISSMQRTLTSSRCPTWSVGDQIHTHINICMYIYIYVCIYIHVSKTSLCFHSIPGSLLRNNLSPIQSDVCENNYLTVTTWEVMGQRRELLQAKIQSLMAEHVTEPRQHQLPSRLLKQAHV